MFRLGNSFKALSITVEPFCPVASNLQTVRWGRKPRWFPTAKTKMFNVVPRKQIPEEERVEIRRLYNIYRTQVKSIGKYLTQIYSVENQQQFDIEQHRRTIDEDFARCNEINGQWNKAVQQVRETRVAKELEQNLAAARQRLEDVAKMHADRLEAIEEVVRKEKEASKHFITADKLDAAIEYAINNPVDYNYALDLDGNKIYGRETKPPEKPPVEIKSKITVRG